MFLPGDLVSHPETGDKTLTVVRYEDRHHVVVSTSEGGEQTYPELSLSRCHVKPSDPDVFPRTPRRTAHEIQAGLALVEVLPTLEVDWNGHFECGRLGESGGKSPRVMLEELFGYGCTARMALEDVEAVHHAILTGKPLERFVPLNNWQSTLYECPNCSVRTQYETDGKVIRATTPCLYPDGLVTRWTLNVPSGKILVTDDLRELCRIGSERDLNSAYGTHLAILDYARNGMTVGFGIGNTSPAVIRMPDGSYVIGRREQRIWCVEEGTEGAVLQQEGNERRWYVTTQPADRTGKYDKYGDDSLPNLPEGAEKVASICTDLWAYSMIDLDEARRRAAYYNVDLDESMEGWTVHVIDVEPGTYQFEHSHRARHDEDEKNVTYATFKRIGDATEPEDWSAKDKAFTVGITQAVLIKSHQWPTLYGNDCDWPQQCAGVINSELSGGIPEQDWHPNGHRNCYLHEDVQGIPIKPLPRFRFQYHWNIDRSFIDTTVRRNDALFGGDTPFNQSYALAAGHVLESAVSFGLRVQPHTTEEHARREMHKAAELWYGLIERYPHVATEMPDFAAWMEDRETVKLWIDGFRL